MITVAKKFGVTGQLVAGLGFYSSVIEDAGRLALANEVRQPGAHAHICSVMECD